MYGWIHIYIYIYVYVYINCYVCVQMCVVAACVLHTDPQVSNEVTRATTAEAAVASTAALALGAETTRATTREDALGVRIGV
jgi:hypothetical protein